MMATGAPALPRSACLRQSRSPSARLCPCRADVAFAGLLQAKVRQLHLRSEIETSATFGWQQRLQRPTGQIQRLEEHIAEVNDLARNE